MGSGMYGRAESQSMIGMDWISMLLQPLNHQTNSVLPSYASSAQKGYNYHKTGLEIIMFGCNDDLTSFQDAVMDHLIDTSMDSILYLPDPKDATKMISVITSHSCFTISSMRTHSGTLEPLFDDYDRMNDKAAKRFFLNSLSKELGALIKKKTQDDDTFVIVWMLILQSIQLTSIEVFKEIKNHIKALCAIRRSTLARIWQSWASILLTMPHFLNLLVSTIII
jgi:hypothetical protein